MNGNLCRCGTYERIRKAIHSAADAADKGIKKVATYRPELPLSGGAR
jgi:xanthine dehydrogenase iron-sulfur cluster and FAD-binding subunit A